jgi:hypothetical protein
MLFQLTGVAAKSWQDTIDKDFGTSLVLSDLNTFERTDLQLTLPGNASFPTSPQYPDVAVQRTLNITQRSIETMMFFLRDGSTISYISAALANSNNMTATFESAAWTATNRMREMDTGPLPGSVQQWTVYINVRWQFLILSELIFVATFIFAWVTRQNSRRLKLDALKDDLLEVLIHGLDSDTRNWLREQTDQKLWAETVVRLEGDGERVELRSDLIDE